MVHSCARARKQEENTNRCRKCCPSLASSLYSRVCTVSRAEGAPVNSGASTNVFRSTIAGEAFSIQRSSCVSGGGRTGCSLSGATSRAAAKRALSARHNCPARTSASRHAAKSCMTTSAWLSSCSWSPASGATVRGGKRARQSGGARAWMWRGGAMAGGGADCSSTSGRQVAGRQVPGRHCCEQSTRLEGT